MTIPLNDYEGSELENELDEILPTFKSADYDWKCFGYLLDETPQPSTSCEKSEIESTVIPKPPFEPIGKGRRRRTSHKTKTTTGATTNVRKEVINPADITLGGDTYEYSHDDDSIASHVARRRRTSTNVSKSEEDETTRHPKERKYGDVKPNYLENSPFIGSEYPIAAQQQPDNPADQIDRNALHCSCRTLYDETKFYLNCDMCNVWFHGDCVGVTQKRASKMDGWTCADCLNEERKIKESPQLYCVCKKPYDDTQFYVGCDSCQGWFHPACVNITQEEAEAAAEYICPSCRVEDDQKGYESSSSEGSMSSRASSSLPLLRSDYSHVWQLLELLLEHRMSHPFHKPVDIQEFPDYLSVVSQPMDLSTITKKLESLEYSYLREFVSDVNLMFENAKKYNPKENPIFKCAETMQELFEKKLLEIRELIRGDHKTDRRRNRCESQRTLEGSLDIDADQLISLDPEFVHELYIPGMKTQSSD
ncbi:unnamed protein product [Caenorhabditis bovis]|uniref:Uncharacterized protein n=1 Tax=Caenorhabditis bovis TaxID=2654633 RepID=A0A8S1EW90_9PELO|nr:unnamed protein product [Caenorhabditis bovis]